MATRKVLNLQTAPGHQVLAKAGKKLLRPGGRRATEQLFQWANFQPEDSVLELAASFGHSAIALAQSYGVNVVGVERNADSVSTAQHNIDAANIADKVNIIQGDITQLDTVSGVYDFVLAEAILTMQSAATKAKILTGIHDRLKPGGRFLSHELLVRGDDTKAVRRSLSSAIRVNANPLTADEWRTAFKTAGLEVKYQHIGVMGLLNLDQLLRDEGWLGTLKIGWNTLTQPQLRQRILSMRKVFHDYQDQLGYIVLCVQRSGDVS
ncbi:MAG: class I SAM-dependent methyltransferase [Cyanobacteria bacterium P01_F01_bin.153]